MTTIFLAIIIGIFNIVSFYLGSKITQKIQNNEEIALPNPIRKIEEYKVQEKEKEDKKINEINMENVNNYDGTSAGQKDIPN